MNNPEHSQHGSGEDATVPPDDPFDGEAGRLSEADRIKTNLTRVVCLAEPAEIAAILASAQTGRKRSDSVERVAEYRRRRQKRKEKPVGGVWAPDNDAARAVIRQIGQALIAKKLKTTDLEKLLTPKPDEALEVEHEEETAETGVLEHCRTIIGGAGVRGFLFRILILLLLPRSFVQRS